MMVQNKSPIIGEPITSMEMTIYEQGSGIQNEAVNFPTYTNESSSIPTHNQSRPQGGSVDTVAQDTSVEFNSSSTLSVEENTNVLLPNAVECQNESEIVGHTLVKTNSNMDINIDQHVSSLPQESSLKFLIAPNLAPSGRSSSCSFTPEINSLSAVNPGTSERSQSVQGNITASAGQPQNQLLKQLLGNCSSADSPGPDIGPTLMLVPTITGETVLNQVGLSAVTMKSTGAPKRKNDYIAERRAALEKQPTPPPREVKPKKRVRGPNKRSRNQTDGISDSKTIDSNSNASENSQQTDNLQGAPAKKRVRKSQNKIGKIDLESSESILSTVAARIHNDLPTILIREPEISINNNIASIFGCGDLNSATSKLSGHFGGAVLAPGMKSCLYKKSTRKTVSHYHEEFPRDLDSPQLHFLDDKAHFVDRNCDSPASIISNSSSDQEYLNALDTNEAKDNFREKHDENSLFIPVLNNFLALRKRITRGDEGICRKDINNNGRSMSPTLPMHTRLPISHMPLSVLDELNKPDDNKENLEADEDEENPDEDLQQQSDQASTSLNMRLKDHGNMSVTLTLTNKEADGVKRVLNSLPQLIDYPAHSTCTMQSPESDISQSEDEVRLGNSFRLLTNNQTQVTFAQPNSDIKFDEQKCVPIDHQPIQVTTTASIGVQLDVKPELCRRCKAIVLDSGIRKNINELPEHVMLTLQRASIVDREREDRDIVFCSVHCYAAVLVHQNAPSQDVDASTDSQPSTDSTESDETLTETLDVFKDTRRCVLCHEFGDGNSDGPARLLNLFIDGWVHLNCALWSLDVYELDNGALMNVELACRKAMTCSLCHKTGATLRCFKTRCPNYYHFNCALKENFAFYEDKSVQCRQHAEPDRRELTSFIVNRKVYVNRDEQKQVAEMIEGEQQNVMRIGSLVFLNIGQLLPHQLSTFHSQKNIFPVGYRVIRHYWSYRQLNKRCKYFCAIEDNDGKPQFRIVAREAGYEDEEFLGDSPQSAWHPIIEKIVELRKPVPDTINTYPAFIHGDDLFGLNELSIVRILESLPGVQTITDYDFKFGRSPLLELPLAINPTGCARTEPKLRTHFKRPYTIHTASSGAKTRQLQGSISSCDTTNSPYIKQFTQTKSSQYKKMKSEWRNNVVLARSRVQGLGLYAARDIEKHTMVIEYIGMLIRNEIAERYERIHEAHNRGIYMFRLDDDRVIDATLAGGLARYINHSCNPNCVAEAVEIDRERKILIIANRKIYKGEELGYDYKLAIEDDQHKISCLCGAPTCKKWMN